MVFKSYLYSTISTFYRLKKPRRHNRVKINGEYLFFSARHRVLRVSRQTYPRVSWREDSWLVSWLPFVGILTKYNISFSGMYNKKES